MCLLLFKIIYSLDIRYDTKITPVIDMLQFLLHHDVLSVWASCCSQPNYHKVSLAQIFESSGLYI